MTPPTRLTGRLRHSPSPRARELRQRHLAAQAARCKIDTMIAMARAERDELLSRMAPPDPQHIIRIDLR